MGRHIRHIHPHIQVYRKRERGIERERHTHMCVCMYAIVDAFIWPGIYGGCRRREWAISISIERPRRTAGSCWLRGEYNEEISSEKGMRLRWIRMRGLPPTFISPSPSPPSPPIASNVRARARLLCLSSISSPEAPSKRDRYTPIIADPERHNGLVSVIERWLGHLVPSQVDSIIKLDSSEHDVPGATFPDGAYSEVITS